jgi:gliding motility-associated-like protein
MDTSDIRVFVVCDESQIFIPTVFTPNGDGQNDLFYPRGKGVSLVKTFRIYNRWGELLFERRNFQLNDEVNAWDGMYKGSDPKPDVYVYVMEAVCDTGDPMFIKGDVTIIR